MKIKFLPLIALSLFTCSTQAAEAWCKGKLTLVAQHAPDGLYVELDSAPGIPIRICSFSEKVFRTTADGCKHIASLASMAYAARDNVTIVVDNAPTTQCNSITPWFGADVRYFALSK